MATVQLIAIAEALMAGNDVVGQTLLMMLVPLGMIGPLAALFSFGRYPARDEAAFLRAFLIRTLDAEDSQP